MQVNKLVQKMNSIRLWRVIVLLGSFGLSAPLIAGSGSDNSGPVSDYGSPQSANAPSGPGSQNNQVPSSHYGSDSTGTSGKISGERPSRGSGNVTEKAFNVDPRTLPKSATDPKFQGSLLDLGVKSIEEVKALPETAPRGEEGLKSRANTSTAANDSREAQKEDKAKAVVPRERPSPKPSPQGSASPVAKSATAR